MQVKLADFVQSRAESEEIVDIIASCVHCGFCNATCPTYQLTGNELDGPRGRIYLLKQMLEGQETGPLTQYHLDRCLNCRSCETTCPSGVEYGRLLDLGRVMVDEKVPRPIKDKSLRNLMAGVFPYQIRFKFLIQLTRCFSYLLPRALKQKIPEAKIKQQTPCSNHLRKVLLLSGCVQPTLAPSIDLAAIRVLDKFGITLVEVEDSGCCGALNYHLSEHEKAKALAKKNIDACWKQMEEGVEAILMTASGCGVILKEYAQILKYDADYTEKAVQFSALVKDISEIVQAEDLSVIKKHDLTISFQSPCTLQHGFQLKGVVETILSKIGYSLIHVNNAHLCCGSAGTFSILQPELSEQLREKKLNDLHIDQVNCIATANIGCLSHLQAKTSKPVVHWVELLDETFTCSEL